MNYAGVIIEESLTDKTVLDDVMIIATKIEPITAQHQTPWLRQWTLHSIEVPANIAEAVAEKLSHALEVKDQGGSSWYADYKNDQYHYVIFPNRVFKVKLSQPEQYQAVVQHGLSLGIPEHQLDFAPQIKDWER